MDNISHTLKNKFMGTSSTEATSVKPKTVRSYEEIKTWISTEVANILKIDIDDIDSDQKFSGFGIDSIVAFAMTGDLCEWIGEELPATLLWEYPTIDSLSRYISEQFGESATERRSESSGILLAGCNGQNKLFCICGIGLYQNLADQMVHTMDTYGIYVPPEKSLGKFGKEIDDRYEYVTVEDLARRYVDEIISLKRQGPYYILGVSFGGVLAYEAAQQLSRRGANVPLLILLDAVLPSAVKVGATRYVIEQIKTAISGPNVREIVPEDQIHKLSYEEMGKFRSQYYWTLGKHYDPLPYTGSVLLVRATATKLFGLGYIHDEQLGWRDLVTGNLETIKIDGTHIGILQQPHVSELVSSLCKRIG